MTTSVTQELGHRRGGTKACKFFLQGRCKFGDGCKHTHEVGLGGQVSILGAFEKAFLAD
jgi:hypothetical protein